MTPEERERFQKSLDRLTARISTFNDRFGNAYQKKKVQSVSPPPSVSPAHSLQPIRRKQTPAKKLKPTR